MIQRDYIMRMIYMLTDVLLRVFKLKEHKQYEAALDEIGKTIEELFAAEARLLHIVDPQTAAQLLGHWQKAKILATLYREQGEVYLLQKDPALAMDKFQQAHILFQEALNMKGTTDDECQKSLQALESLITEVQK